MKKPSCRVQTLAVDGHCQIGYCLDCKVFHLQIGYATLHLNPEAFVALGGTINTALARLRRHNPASNAEQFTSSAEAEKSLH